jgi:hypothetical protein
LQTAAVRDVLEERRFHDVMGETTTATSGRRPRSKLKMTISSTRPQRQSVRQRLPASGGERQHLEGDALDADTLMMMAGLVRALGRAQFGRTCFSFRRGRWKHNAAHPVPWLSPAARGHPGGLVVVSRDDGGIDTAVSFQGDSMAGVAR